MRPRSELHTLLLAIHAGINVYHQAPTKDKMQYPCILYKRSGVETGFANNFPFIRTREYELIVIDPDPDSEIPDKVGALPMCTFDRHYAADQLNHDVFTLFF